MSQKKRVNRFLEELKELGVQLVNRRNLVKYYEFFPEEMEPTKRLIRLALNELPDATLSLELVPDIECPMEIPTVYARFPEYDDSVMNRIIHVQERFFATETLDDHMQWPVITTDFKKQ